MNKKIIGIFIVMLLIVSGYSAIATINKKIINRFTSTYDPLDGGWVEEIDGVKILHVSGSYYEMGYQQGYLLKEEFWEFYRGIMSFYELAGYSMDDLMELWNVMKDFIPQEYKDEARGLSNGSGLPLEEAYASLVASAFVHDTSACSGVSAWGSSTIDGKLYHMRSYDWSLDIVDPESGNHVYDNQFLMIRKPDDGYASLCPMFPGNIGHDGGINEKGIAINSMCSWSNKDRSNLGSPMTIRQRMALDKASNIDEVIDIINSNRTRGWNFIVSDGKVPVGYAIEQTANYSYVGTWDDPIESNKPFWEIKDVVRRGNFFIHPDCAAQQRRQYYPWSFLLYFINGPLASSLGNYDPYKYWYYPQWMRYKAISNGIENILGSIDLETGIQMIRKVYRGETLNIMGFKNPYIFAANTTFQWTSCPETGDFAVSFSSGMTNAHETDVHYFNLYELMESEPP